MTARTFAVVCAWCKATIRAGAPGAPVTHSICPSCADWTCRNPHIAPDGQSVCGDDYFVLPPRPEAGTAKH